MIIQVDMQVIKLTLNCPPLNLISCIMALAGWIIIVILYDKLMYTYYLCIVVMKYKSYTQTLLTLTQTTNKVIITLLPRLRRTSVCRRTITVNSI